MEQEEVVYEYTPEAAPSRPSGIGAGGAASLQSSRTAALSASSAVRGNEGVDTSNAPVQEAFKAFTQREQQASSTKPSGPARPRQEFEALGSTPALARLETPEQRLLRLQGEVAELLLMAEGAAHQDGDPGASAALMGADPAAVVEELRALEQRLGSLARTGPAAWRSRTEAVDGPAGRGAMAGSLVSQLERLALGGSLAASVAEAAAASDGRVTYEISYSPDVGAVAESANIAALENSVAEIEKQLGVLEPSCPYSDLQTAVVQLQHKMSLLDPQRLESIRASVHKVMGDLDQALAKKAELMGANADPELDRKVSELYDFCHRWSATAASLPSIVARLQSLQALHQQSSSFATRLTALEQQQDELVKLLETTNKAVQELGVGLKENMNIVKDNMKSLEEKMQQALRA